MEDFKEEWRPIAGYEGIYEVSNSGDVASLNYNKKTGVRRIRKQKLTKDGYLEIALCKDNKVKHIRVHRLVAEAFVPNPCGYRQINHKDENKTNNLFDNLEWCDAKYNINYGTGIKRRSESASIPVVKKTKEGDFVRRYKSVSDAAEDNGMTTSEIVLVCNGHNVSANGFKWEYEDGSLKNDASSVREGIVKGYSRYMTAGGGFRKRAVLQFSVDGNLVGEYPSSYSAEKATGFGNNQIRANCNGARKTVHGFIFKWKDDNK